MADDENVKRASDVDADANAGFVNRWSRRKLRARAGVADDQDAVLQADAVPVTEEPEFPAAESQAPDQLTDAEMPPLATLNEDSDYSDFFSPRVSAKLRRQALRKLFLSPKFNVRDRLDSEGGDFTKFQPLGDTITADMRHQLERAEQALKRYAEQGGAEAGLDEASAAEKSAPDETSSTEDDAKA